MPLSPSGIAYDLRGPEGAPVVVLIHGIGLNRHVVWAPIARWLAGRFRVLSYDLPGHGDSLPEVGDMTLTKLSNHLIRLMDDLEIPHASLVGFSIGGMINRRVAIDNPRRVTALGILNSPHERDPDLQAQAVARARETSTGAAASIEATLERWFTPEYRIYNRALVEEVKAVVLACDRASFSAHQIVLAEGVEELIRPVPPIMHPTLVMTCAKDARSTPAMSAAIAAEIAGAELEIVPDLQHLGLIERPMVFACRIEAFLSGVLT